MTIFDSPMCCPTGVCGPAVDPALVRFAADLNWLMGQGIEVTRINLAQEPAAFAQNTAVGHLLRIEGNDCLPLILVDGVIVSKGIIPARDRLAEMAKITFASAPSVVSAEVAELIAIGASVASNCEPCFRFHYDRARKLGVSREDMARAVEVAQSVKEAPARSILILADRYLKSDAAGEAAALPTASPAFTVARGGKCC